MPTRAAEQAFHQALSGDDAIDLYERAPCGYLSTRTDGTIVKANQTFLTWTGYHVDDLVGVKRFRDLLGVGARIFHETHVAPSLHMHGSVNEVAFDIVCADGSLLPALVTSVVDADAEGGGVVRIAVFEAVERRRYEAELLGAKQRAEASEAAARRMAETLQQTLIPPAVPTIDGLDLAAVYRPAGDGSEVGGDFYDVFEVVGGWIVVVGDVCGKGVDAAVVTAAVRFELRSATMRHNDLADVLGDINTMLLQHPAQRFCTISLVKLSRRGDAWRASIASGGHPPPILTGAGRAPIEVDVAGTLVGAVPDVRFDVTDVVLAPGDGLVLYTDGATEARRGRSFLGEDGLLRSVERHAGPVGSLVAGVLDEVLAFQEGNARDDIVIAGLRVPPVPSIPS